MVQEGKVLSIININRSDAGTFTCTAYNGFSKPENQTVYVDVTCEYALKKLQLSLKRDALSILLLCCNVLCCHIFVLMFGLRYIHAGLQAQFLVKLPCSDLQL